MILMSIVAVITVLIFISSVLLFPSVGKVKIYPFIPLVGGVIMIALGDVTWANVLSAFTEDSSVNPIKILVLFLSMTVYSLILDRTGFFGYISGVVLKRAGHRQITVFLSLYVVISVLTVFTSNDIVILTFTPFICKFCKAAKIDVIPYLIMEFVTANTWSLLLLIGNPTNIYLSGAFEIGFAEYFVHMAIPTVAAGATSLGIMLLMFGKRLRAQINTEAEIQKITDKPLMILALSHLIVCIVLLAVSQYTGIEMWLISLAVALSALVGSAVLLIARRKRLTPLVGAVRGMPFEIVPFVIGMFVIVMALDGSGVTAVLASFIGNGNGVLDCGFASLLSSNLLNNIPMSVLFSKVLAVTPSMSEVYATIVGSNLGAFITPIGALAGIMWSNLVKENNVKLSVGKFVGYGTGIAVPSALASLGALLFFG